MNTGSYDAFLNIDLNKYSKNFDTDISEFFAKILSRVFKRKDTISLTIAQRVFEELVNTTPVDTGFARANWVVGVNMLNAPRIKYGPQYPPPKYMGPIKTRTQDEWVISNFAHYIGYLNEGHSRQAPAGFVEKAIYTGIQKAQAELRSIKETRESRPGYSPKYKR